MGGSQSQPYHPLQLFPPASSTRPSMLLLLAGFLLSPAFSLVTVEAQNWSQEDQYSQASSQQRNSGTSFNTTHISQVLNKLTDRARYDKRLRPRYGEGPVDVGITVHVSSISAVSEVDMDFTIDFYLRQTWHDPRLAFGKFDTGFERIERLTVGIEYLDRLWKPDTFFPNEKKSFFHTSTTHNSFLRIDPDGKVSISQRLTVTATCPMQLRLFPMDSQVCKLEIESYGYADHDIDMYWGASRADSKEPHKAVQFEKFSLPQFKRTGYRVNVTKATTASGVYVRLYFEILLSRNLGFYLMNIIIPSMLIVSISWVSFWLSREASPARVGLGVTTVLTMTTLITTTNNAMPKVSYIKGLDVFLNFCFVMVFASLVEYAVVAYWNKRQQRDRERRRKRGGDGAGTSPPAVVEFPMFANYPTTPTGGLAVTPPPPSTASVQGGAASTLLVPPGKGTGADYVYRAPGLLAASANAKHQLQGPTANITTSMQPQPPGPQTLGADSAAMGMPIPSECDCRAIPLMMEQQDYGLGGGAGWSVAQMAPQFVPPPAFLNMRHRKRLMKAAINRSGGPGGSPAAGTTLGYGVYTMRRARGGSGGMRWGWRRRRWCCGRLSPSKIDRCSRSLFPLLFICFNCIYWSVLTYLSQVTATQEEFVYFTE